MFEVSERINGEWQPHYLGTFQGTVRGDESNIHPSIVYDEDSGDIYVVAYNPKDEKAYVVYRKGKEWSEYEILDKKAKGKQSELERVPLW